MYLYMNVHAGICPRYG